MHIPDGRARYCRLRAKSLRVIAGDKRTPEDYLAEMSEREHEVFRRLGRLLLAFAIMVAALVVLAGV